MKKENFKPNNFPVFLYLTLISFVVSSLLILSHSKAEGGKGGVAHGGADDGIALKKTDETIQPVAAWDKKIRSKKPKVQGPIADKPSTGDRQKQVDDDPSGLRAFFFASALDEEIPTKARTRIRHSITINSGTGYSPYQSYQVQKRSNFSQFTRNDFINFVEDVKTNGLKIDDPRNLVSLKKTDSSKYFVPFSKVDQLTAEMVISIKKIRDCDNSSTRCGDEDYYRFPPGGIKLIPYCLIEITDNSGLWKFNRELPVEFPAISYKGDELRSTFELPERFREYINSSVCEYRDLISSRNPSPYTTAKVSREINNSFPHIELSLTCDLFTPDTKTKNIAKKILVVDNKSYVTFEVPSKEITNPYTLKTLLRSNDQLNSNNSTFILYDDRFKIPTLNFLEHTLIITTDRRFQTLKGFENNLQSDFQSARAVPGYDYQSFFVDNMFENEYLFINESKDDAVREFTKLLLAKRDLMKRGVEIEDRIYSQPSTERGGSGGFLD